jgi:hypothetical protein
VLQVKMADRQSVMKLRHEKLQSEATDRDILVASRVQMVTALIGQDETLHGLQTSDTDGLAHCINRAIGRGTVGTQQVQSSNLGQLFDNSLTLSGNYTYVPSDLTLNLYICPNGVTVSPVGLSQQTANVSLYRNY